MAKMKNRKECPPSVLAFERKLEPSDALMYAGLWNERNQVEPWITIPICEKAIRGTTSHSQAAKKEDPAKKQAAKDEDPAKKQAPKDEDPAKLNQHIDGANIQKVDIATIPNDKDTLKLAFTLKIIGNVGVPCACNNNEYRKKLLENVDKYKKEYSFDELSRRYAHNIANGRFLWRNRLGAEEIEIHADVIKKGKIEKSFVFNAFNFSLRNFGKDGESDNNLIELAEIIKQGFLNSEFTLLEINAFARIGKGQEVFPSQEFIDKPKDKKKKNGSKSKVLYAVNAVAAMHSQKIGNAIRTIDTWYSENNDDIGPIAIEPYGAVTTHGHAYRIPKDKSDLYTILDNWMIKNETPAVNEQHFIIANLIRGGVYGTKGSNEGE